MKSVIVAHRGYSAAYPENSLLAMLAAIASGARAVECDIQFTQDGVPVLYHDASGQRLSAQPVDITQSSWQAIKQWPNHYPQRFQHQFAGNKISRLADMVTVIHRHEVEWFIEIKHESLAHMTLDHAMQAVYDQVQSVQSKVWIISFVPEVISWAKQRGLQTGWVLPAFNSKIHNQADQLSPDLLIVDTRKVIEPARLWPAQWMVYVVNTRQDYEIWRSRVKWIETDDIGSHLFEHLRS